MKKMKKRRKTKYRRPKFFDIESFLFKNVYSIDSFSILIFIVVQNTYKNFNFPYRSLSLCHKRKTSFDQPQIKILFAPIKNKNYEL